jgi:hypothetical protein
MARTRAQAKLAGNNSPLRSLPKSPQRGIKKKKQPAKPRRDGRKMIMPVTEPVVPATPAPAEPEPELTVVPPRPRSPVPSPLAYDDGLLSGDELLQAIIANRDECRRLAYTDNDDKIEAVANANNNSGSSDNSDNSDTSDAMEATASEPEPESASASASESASESEPQHHHQQQQELQTPVRASVLQNNTPKSTGWGLRSLFTRFTAIASPAGLATNPTTPAATTNISSLTSPGVPATSVKTPVATATTTSSSTSPPATTATKRKAKRTAIAPATVQGVRFALEMPPHPPTRRRKLRRMTDNQVNASDHTSERVPLSTPRREDKRTATTTTNAQEDVNIAGISEKARGKLPVGTTPIILADNQVEESDRAAEHVPLSTSRRKGKRISLTDDQAKEYGRAFNDPIFPTTFPSTPQRKLKRGSQTDKPKSKKMNATLDTPRSVKRATPGRRRMVEHTVQKFELENKANADERVRATKWAMETAEKIAAAAGASVGEKRKHLDQPLKLKDVKEIPSSYPWQTGSFGLLDEFWEQDSSDDEAVAPMWYKMDQTAKEPPLKKRKTLSDASRLSQPDLPIIDSNYNSSSRRDLHPRPSWVPSPMFDNPTTHHEDANIFQEQDMQNPPRRVRTPAEQAAFDKELRRYGHVEGSGTFCFPEGSSDEEDWSEDEAAETTQGFGDTWTQSPPPAPVPAHASLPGPIATTPSVPDVQQTPFEALRAKLMNTPAKPSRLREVMVPSPSLNSDAGGSPLFASRGLAKTPIGQAFLPLASTDYAQYDDMPDATPLDLGDPQLLAEATAYFESEAYQAKTADAWGGSAVVMTYDESEEALTDDE